MIQPDSLQIGDQVGLIATARKVEAHELTSAINILSEWGLQVLESPFLFEEDHQFAGNDNIRSNSLQWALDHPKLKAVFVVRGGYGTARIVDLCRFHYGPKKWFVGFSDVTVLHTHLNNHGCQSIHGPIPLLFDQKGGATSLNKLRQLLFGDRPPLNWDSHSFNKTGQVAGTLIGGNLSVLHCALNTTSDFDPKGKILFIEDLDEYLYHLDRMMNHMQRAAKFNELKGIIIGHFSDMNDNKIPFGESAYEIIHRTLKDFTGPIAFGAPIGHQPTNHPVICGASVTLSVDHQKSTLSYSGKV